MTAPILRRDRFMTDDELREVATHLAHLEARIDRIVVKLQGRASAAWLDRLVFAGSARRPWFVVRSAFAREWGERPGNPFEGAAWGSILQRASDELDGVR